MRRLALAILIAGGLGGPATGADGPERVDLNLVLAVDSSSSVDPEEFALQMTGIAAAFRTPAVIEAIEGGTHHAIAVTVMEWSNATWQRENIAWTVIHDAASARRFADAVENAPRLIYGGATSISGGLRFALRRLAASPRPAERAIIDVSGDGANNQGAPVADARRDAVAAGVTINGLAVINEEPDLEQYYRTEVIGGSGAFVLIANDYEDFAQAVLRKLLREIEAVPVARAPVAPAGASMREPS